MRMLRITGLALLALGLVSGDASAQNGTRPNVVKPEAPTLGAPGQPASRDVATLLFETPQWSKAPVGSTLTYGYAKTVSDPALGQSFTDTIKLTLDKAEDEVHRTIEAKMFSGANAKPAGPFESTAQNPVLLLVFENNVQELGDLFKANPRFLKNTIRTAWRDKAKIEDVQIMVNGKAVAGTRITVTPFADSPDKDKMLGLEGMTYVVEIADSVPGQVARIDIHAPATGTPKFSEVLHYESISK